MDAQIELNEKLELKLRIFLKRKIMKNFNLI